MLDSEFRYCLEQLDVVGIRKLWRHVSPHLPQPKDDHEALVTIHQARTRAESMAMRLRFYSHRWLLDNGYESGLPDRLKPSAERVYPRVVEAVGISCNATSSLFRPITGIIQGAMSDAVLECYADGERQPEIVKGKMMEARRKTISNLLGISGAK